SNRRLGLRRKRLLFLGLRLGLFGGERFPGRGHGRSRGGRRRFARKPGEPRFDPSKVELEALQPLAIAERHDETDDSEHRKGDHHDDESGEEGVHSIQLCGCRTKPMLARELPGFKRLISAIRAMTRSTSSAMPSMSA